MTEFGPLKVGDCSAEDFELIKKHIAEFELDDRDLQQNQFVTVRDQRGLLGFGRVREYAHLSEMCSLGVLINERSKGLGKLLTQAMMNKAKKTIYLACIIPSFFESFGFEICKNFPPEMQDKLDYCNDSLHVEEEYVVMRKDL